MKLRGSGLVTMTQTLQGPAFCDPERFLRSSRGDEEHSRRSTAQPPPQEHRLGQLCGGPTSHVVAVNLSFFPLVPWLKQILRGVGHSPLRCTAFLSCPPTPKERKAMCLCWHPVEELCLEQGRPRKLMSHIQTWPAHQ